MRVRLNGQRYSVRLDGNGASAGMPKRELLELFDEDELEEVDADPYADLDKGTIGVEVDVPEERLRQILL